MAGFKKLETGVKSNIMSFRIGGDKVDKALTKLHAENKTPVQDIIRTAIVLYSQQRTEEIRILKNQKRNG